MARPRKWNANKLAKDINEYILTHDLPFEASICTDLDVSHDTLWRLSKESEVLSATLKKAQKKCESNILQRGITGRYQSNVAIFLLKNYGWSDKQEQEIDFGCKVTISGGDEYAQ